MDIENIAPIQKLVVSSFVKPPHPTKKKKELKQVSRSFSICKRRNIRCMLKLRCEQKRKLYKNAGN